ncbi:MAG: alcohol dehydrogenase catalytic domain-containing protein [Clostridia bacterium]|nr:alcohol dehydrogenase catalytic domain-containing protein [Clostridia bacterium]
MKKLVMKGPKQSTLIDVPMPKLEKDTDVLIKLTYCGVCMSEHYAWSTATAGMSFGHEPIGVVEAIGSAVTLVKVGDRVSFGGDGSAEYTVHDQKGLVKIPNDITDVEAIVEPLYCILGAVTKLRLPMPGDKVAIVGCGYMGCGAISLLTMRGYDVVAVDIRKECLEDAKKYGAKEVYLPEELPEGYLTDKAAPFETGFPVVMEWGETNESLDLAIRMTRMCGQLAIGAYHTGGKRLVDIQRLNFMAIDCLSTHPREEDFHCHAAYNAMELIASGKWNYKTVPTKVYSITDFDKAQEELTSKYGKYMKAIVDWQKMELAPYVVG